MVDISPIPWIQMKEAVEWIRDRISGNKIMLFCNLGVGRSPSIRMQRTKDRQGDDSQEEVAHKVAWAAVKQEYKKDGDKWKRK